jgi:hypothetical protein
VLIERVRTLALVEQRLVDDDCSHEEYLRAAESALLPAASTIVKWRRWYQRNGKFPPTDPDVAKRRGSASNGQAGREDRPTKAPGKRRRAA